MKLATSNKCDGDRGKESQMSGSSSLLLVIAPLCAPLALGRRLRLLLRVLWSAAAANCPPSFVLVNWRHKELALPCARVVPNSVEKCTAMELKKRNCFFSSIFATVTRNSLAVGFQLSLSSGAVCEWLRSASERLGSASTVCFGIASQLDDWKVELRARKREQELLSPELEHFFPHETHETHPDRD